MTSSSPSPRPTVPLTQYDEVPSAEMLARARAFTATMQRRRTVRQFSDRAVDRAMIDTCLTAAGTAPSGAHQQPWRAQRPVMMRMVAMRSPSKIPSTTSIPATTSANTV